MMLIIVTTINMIHVTLASDLVGRNICYLMLAYAPSCCTYVQQQGWNATGTNTHEMRNGTIHVLMALCNPGLGVRV